MARLLLIIFAICVLFTTNANATQNTFEEDANYQSMAEDFRTYSVCQAIHSNLGMFIVINYGVGANLKFPTAWLEQQRGLIQNIASQQVIFGDKLEVVINKLHEEYGFPLQGLHEQKRLNQANTTQGIIFSISSSMSNPDEAIAIVKGMLNESKRCREYESKFNYEE